MRNLLRRFRSAVISVSAIQDVLNLRPVEAEEFLHRMVNLGLIELSEHFSTEDRRAYEVSDPGLAFANASAAKPITRKTANRALQEFMDRVQVIDVSDEYPYKIESVVLFGSLLSGKERLGDVDLAVELRPATPDDREFHKRCNCRYFVALMDERRLYSDFEWITWPTLEIFRFLRSRSRSLDLHSLNDLIGMNAIPYRILHGVPDRLSAMIPGGLPV